MLRYIPRHRTTVAIGITVHAAMRAGVIHSDVRPQKAAALCAGRFFLLRHRQAAASCCLKHSLRHAAGNVNAKLCKRYIFAAGTNRDSVLSADFRKPCSKVLLLRFRHRPSRREVPLGLFIQAKKAYDAGVDLILQCGGHLPKGLQMILHGVFFGDENGIVTPANRLRPDYRRQLLNGFQYGSFVRHIRLDLLPIGRQRNKPELPKTIKLRKPRNHRRGIFRAEAENIHHRWVKGIPQDLLRAKRVSRAYISFFDTMIEPSTVICRNVRPTTGIQNHDFASTIQITRPSFRSFGAECLSPSRNSLKEAVQQRNSQLECSTAENPCPQESAKTVQP